MLFDEIQKVGFLHCYVKDLFENYTDVMKDGICSNYIIMRTLSAGEIIVEGITFPLKSDEYVYISPKKQIDIKSFRKLDAHILIFSSEFFLKSSYTYYLLNSEVFMNVSPVFIRCNLITRDEFSRWILHILKSYKGHKGELYPAMIHNYIERLILEGLYFANEKGIVVHGISNIRILNDFYYLVNKYYKKDRTISFYADKLNITQRKLSAIIEEGSGKTAKQFLTEKLVKESSHLLIHSDMTISEICYEMGFNDEAYFTNFIKKNTKKTPKQIRSSKSDKIKENIKR